jgi:hypothetical protein
MPIDQLFKIVVKESGEEERLLLPYPTFAPRLFSARISSSDIRTTLADNDNI